MKLTLTVAVLASLSFTFPAAAQVTPKQTEQAQEACRKQARPGVELEVKSVTVLADGRLSVECDESKRSKSNREDKFDEKKADYDQEVNSYIGLWRIAHLLGYLPNETDEMVERRARDSAGTAPVFVAVAVIALTIGSTSSTNSTAP